MNTRGILFQTHHHGTQRHPGGQRGDWWVSASSVRTAIGTGRRSGLRARPGRSTAGLRGAFVATATVPSEGRARPILLGDCWAWSRRLQGQRAATRHGSNRPRPV